MTAAYDGVVVATETTLCHTLCLLVRGAVFQSHLYTGFVSCVWPTLVTLGVFFGHCSLVTFRVYEHILLPD